MNNSKQKVLELYPTARLHYNHKRITTPDRYIIQYPLHTVGGLQIYQKISIYTSNEFLAWDSAWEHIQERMIDALGK